MPVAEDERGKHAVGTEVVLHGCFGCVVEGPSRLRIVVVE
jgi:hypothetical protein